MNIMVRERAHATGPDCSASMMAWVLFGGMSWFASMRYLPPRTPLSTQPHEANSAKGLWAGSRGGQGREDAHPGIGDGSKVHGVVWELGGLVSVRVDGHLRADMQRIAALDPLRPRVLPRPYTHRQGQRIQCFAAAESAEGELGGCGPARGRRPRRGCRALRRSASRRRPSRGSRSGAAPARSSTNTAPRPRSAAMAIRRRQASAPPAC